MRNEGVINLKRRNLIIVVLVIALIGLGYWGFRNNRILTQWKLQAENQYKNAFQELNIHLDSLKDEMTTALVTKSNERRLVKLNNMWRDAFAAQEDLGELPIAGVSLVQLKNLLSKIEHYTYTLAQDHVTGDLSAQDWNNINKLHDQIKEASSNLEEVHTKMEQKDFEWNKRRNAILEKEDVGAGKNKEKSVVSSFHALEEKLKAGQVNLGLAEKPSNKFMLKLGEVKGEKINNDEAIDVARDFLGPRSKEYNFELADDQLEDQRIIRVIARAKNAEDDEIYFNISQGGEVILFLERRDFGAAKIEADKAKKYARDFIKTTDYEDLVIRRVDSSGGIFQVNFVPEIDEVLIYPRRVMVKVARDNGDIVGFDARKYMSNKELDVKLKPKLSTKEAEERVNKRLDLNKDDNLVVITNDHRRRILCREFTGKFKDNMYKVYINAHSGREERVIRVKPGE